MPLPLLSLPLDQVIAWLIAYGYAVFFLIMIFEGPIITVIGGFLASLGYFNLLAIYLISIAGDIIGDLIYYAIGRLGKKRFAARGKLLGITKDHMLALETYIGEHTKRSLFFGKLTHVVGWAILVAAGLAEVPIGEFVWFNLLATIPKSFFFLLLGYYFGHAYQHINNYLETTTLILFVPIIFITWYTLKKSIMARYDPDASLYNK